MTHTPLHSLRVAYENWYDEERFSHLLHLLDESPCDITQIALFTASTHIPLPLDELSHRVDIMKIRLDTLRSAGFSGGINILSTNGHHNENLDAGLGDEFTYMTNILGDGCRGSYCIRSQHFLEDFVVPCYTILANAKPDFIWIDDDVRYVHMPVGNGCFCDHCLNTFNKKYNTFYTRETLRTALNQFDVPLRKHWLDHNSDALCDLFRIIGKTVRDINPDIILGFMTGERYFEGYQFAAYADALSENGTYPIMWRPGDGAYTDINFDAIIEKQERIGRQNAYLPKYINIIQTEIENFPYQLLKKTPKSTAIEVAMSMTVGCTGAAFNILPSETGESLDAIKPHLRAINRLTPFYRTTAELLKGLSPEGIHTGWRIDSQAAVPVGEFAAMTGEMYATYARELFFFGLPECYDKDKANVVTMTGQSAAVLNDDEIRVLLSKGVYLNVSALTHLRERGFGDVLGFSVGDMIPVDARECYADHPLNEGFVNGIRNCRQSFYYGDGFSLNPEAASCQCLSSLVNYQNRVLCDCTSGIYENNLSGRVCVAGYYPYSWISDTFKTQQLKRLFVWLSRGIPRITT